MQKYQNAVLNQNGNVIVGATVTVTDLGGTPVAVYAVNDTNSGNVNPLTTSSDGRFEFYAPDGRYSLNVSFGGNVVASITDILLEDPLDGSNAAFADVSVSGTLTVNDAVFTGSITGLPPSLSNPMTTAGDIITGGALGAPQRLPIGANEQFLTVAAGVPGWTTFNAALVPDGTVTTPKIQDKAITKGKIQDFPTGIILGRTTAGTGPIEELTEANYARINRLQTFTVSQRGTATTDNDLSFDLNATNNFTCTPSAPGTLTFTNITAGQSGFILLDNSGAHAISAAATTKVSSGFLAAVSVAGVYLLSYYSNGTNVYVVASGALA